MAQLAQNSVRQESLEVRPIELVRIAIRHVLYVVAILPRAYLAPHLIF